MPSNLVLYALQSFSCILLCLCATFLIFYIDLSGFPWWLSSKDSACSAGDKEDIGWIPGSARSPGGGNDNPLQYSCLKNPMDRGAWQTIVWRDTKSQMWQDTQSALICQFTYAHTHTHTHTHTCSSAVSNLSYTHTHTHKCTVC